MNNTVGNVRSTQSKRRFRGVIHQPVEHAPLAAAHDPVAPEMMT